MSGAPKPSRSVDPDLLNAFVRRIQDDMGAIIGGALVHIGDKLGLYKALAADGPMDSATLAAKTGTAERYIREWLSQQAAAGYIAYSKDSKTFSIEPEQAMVFADESSPVFMGGFFDFAIDAYAIAPRIAEAFRTGEGVGWHEHGGSLFYGTERFFRTSYQHHLISDWLPAFDGLTQKLTAGARVADVGCGHGASTIVMAKAFPNSRFFGFDYYDPLIECARERAQEAGVADRVTFTVASATAFPGFNFDLVTFFDCLHGMGDPVGAARHVRESLSADGTWMIVEPLSFDSLEDNLNPVGRIFYGASTLVCMPGSLSQEVGAALGAQAGEARLRDVLVRGGFSRIRRVAETPFSMVLEARP